MSGITCIALIGFGEVGQILADDLVEQNSGAIAAWDVKFPFPDSPPARAIASRPLRRASDAVDAVYGADMIISAVTAEQTVQAAKAVAFGLRAGAFFFDLNSASPGQKREAAGAIEAAGGRYVEGAVMSPVPPKRIGSPILLGGSHAELFLAPAQALGFSGLSVFSEELGPASAAKMCRSVIVKGIEALLAESLLTARHFNVEDTVLASLDDFLPGPDWRKLAKYMMSRSIEHGRRRAEEMREVARTVAEAGLSPLMSAACAERQEWAPQFAAALGQETLKELLQAVLDRLVHPEEKKAS